MNIATLGDVLSVSIRNMWIGVIGFIPNLLIALVIILLGWLIGVLLGRVVSQIIKAIKIDDALRRAGVEEFLNRGGLNLNSGAFLGGLVRWFVIIAFLIASFEVLGLYQVTGFLRDILNYLPQVIVAVLILIAAGIVADAMKKIVLSSAKTAELSAAPFLATVTKWVIWVFAILVALSQLGIAAGFIQTVFTGLVVALSLGLGLAFGLGGQEAASRVIDRVSKEISDKK
jgi:small-conductance mechanosensitive channel